MLVLVCMSVIFISIKLVLFLKLPRHYINQKDLLSDSFCLPGVKRLRIDSRQRADGTEAGIIFFSFTVKVFYYLEK